MAPAVKLSLATLEHAGSAAALDAPHRRSTMTCLNFRR